LRAGTELAFETEVQPQYGLLQRMLSLVTGRGGRRIPHRVGRFRKVDTEEPTAHHDAIEFPDGQVVLLTYLRHGQLATVLQLPADGTQSRERHLDERQSPKSAIEAN
jgi:hypothetical protein